MEDYTILKEKVSFFKKNNIKVHILLKNQRIHNGFILEHHGDMVILDEVKRGAMPIYFIEIKLIEKYVEKNGKNLR